MGVQREVIEVLDVVAGLVISQQPPECFSPASQYLTLLFLGCYKMFKPNKLRMRVKVQNKCFIRDKISSFSFSIISHFSITLSR